MKLTLPHYTSQKIAIQTIDQELNKYLNYKFPGLEIIDPEKKWDNNIMRFSFTVEKMFLTLEFSGNLIVTDQEAILEGDLPAIVTTFIPEEKIKETIKKKFNQLFNITK
jgi:hypothetical protein